MQLPPNYHTRQMTVRLKPAHAITRHISPSSLQKFLKSQQNVTNSSRKIWKEEEEEEEENATKVRTLKLSHPILRILESCDGSSIEVFNQVHAQLIVSGLSQHPLSAGRAIKKLCSSRASRSHAVSLFAHLSEPDAFICNTIIRSYVHSNEPENALEFYNTRMVPQCVKPNHYTFPLLTKICAELGLIREGERAHGGAAKIGFEMDLYVQNSLIHMYFAFGKIECAQKVFDARFESDLVTWNSMIDGYAKNGMVDVARRVFDEMGERDVVSWNAMIAGYVGIEDLEAAEELFEILPVTDVVSWNSMIDGYGKIGEVSIARKKFDQMPKRNLVSWNTMLALYVRAKDYSECLKLFDNMMSKGEMKPNEATLVSVLTACANSGELDRGKWVHSYIKDNKRIISDVLLSTTLLTMYAKCGDMDAAKRVFDGMPERSIVSWNSIMMGYAMHGQGEKAFEMFIEMEKGGQLRPNDVTFICLLCACTHGGMVLEGWWCFNLMHRAYNIEPKVEHYGCMVDLLGRAGLLRDSEQLIKSMPVEPAPALWGALMSACRTHSNCELGEIVGKRLIELEPTDVGPYVLLSNIYAAEGRWDDVEKVRKMMKEMGLDKTAGHSLVDVSSDSYEAFEDESSGHRKRMVYSMLSEMGARMKLACRDVELSEA